MKIWFICLLFFFESGLYCCENGVLDEDHKFASGSKLCDMIAVGSIDGCKNILDTLPDKALMSSEVLPYAAFKNNLEICQQLILYGAKPDNYCYRGYTALHWAAANGNKALCEMLLANGATIDAKVLEDYGCYTNFTPLFFAIGAGNVELSKLFIELGADINHQAVFWMWKKTPLDYAAELGNFEICRFLLMNGAQPRENFEYGTPEIINLVKMVHQLKQLNEKKLSLGTFKNLYLSTELESRKNIFSINSVIVALWGMKSEIFGQLWSGYSESLKNYFFLETDFQLLKQDKMEPQDFCKQYLSNGKLEKNLPNVLGLLEREKNDTRMFDVLITALSNAPKNNSDDKMVIDESSYLN